MTGPMTAILVTLLACGDKDGGDEPECPNLRGTPCEDVGIAADRETGYCDACEQLWVCYDRSSSEGDSEFLLYQHGRSCSCIGPDGYIYGPYDSGAPEECQFQTD